MPFHLAREIEAHRYVFLGNDAYDENPPIVGTISAVLEWEKGRRNDCNA